MTGPAMVRPATQFWLLESSFSIVSNDDWLKMITSENNNLWCGVLTVKLKLPFIHVEYTKPFIKQLLDEVEHDIMNYQNQGLCYLPKPKAEADNTDTRFW